jgi:hypothetical protein
MTTDTTKPTRSTRTARAGMRALPAAESARTEPKPGAMARVALSERVRAALRCATSASFVAPAARPHVELAEPAPFICG